MKQETLKKVIGLAEGFKAREDSPRLYLPNGIGVGFYYLKEDMMIYPLILRRAVEGWNNKEYDHEIVSGRTCMDIMDHDGIDNFQFSSYEKTDYLTPQEQAIEACLIELLESDIQ